METPSFAGWRATLLDGGPPCSVLSFSLYLFICWGLHTDFAYAVVHVWKLVLSFHHVRPREQIRLIRPGTSAFTCCAVSH